jgi:hypothetical protein
MVRRLLDRALVDRIRRTPWSGRHQSAGTMIGQGELARIYLTYSRDDAAMASLGQETINAALDER